MTDLLTSPLDVRHRELGAKMANFGGWDMPIEYPGGGVVREHTAVRERVGLFDVSHLGKASVQGKGALDFVNSCLTNDLGKIGPGQAQYTLCCTSDGGVVDDLIVYLRSDDDLFLIPNAANTAQVVAMLQKAAPDGVTVTNLHADYAVLALQGPASPQVMETLGLKSEHGYMSFVEQTWRGIDLTVCRTGYTGETGFELVCPSNDALTPWDSLIEAMAEVDGLPCGLGARDTLRTEMGYPLHGQDLSVDISPVQAGSGWAVGWKKPEFWGREALIAEKESGPKRVLRGLELVARGIPRAHCAVEDGEGNVIGEVTSGTFSPTLSKGIALALIKPNIDMGAHVFVDVRGRKLEAVVTKPPFVAASTKA